MPRFSFFDVGSGEDGNDENISSLAAKAAAEIDDRLISVQYISVENYDDDEESSPRPTANDIFFNNVVNSATTATHYDEYDGHAAASESRSFTFTVGTTGTDAERQLLSPHRKTSSLDIRATAAATTVDDIDFANRRLLIQSTDSSLVDDDDNDTSASTTTTSSSTSSSLSNLSYAPGSSMTIVEGVREIQPLGGPKYYVVVNTKKGRAKIVHEGMPAAGREGFIMDMDEKGFEIMEYDLLAAVPERRRRRRRRRHHDEKNDGNRSSTTTSSRSMSAPKARTSDDVVGTMDYNAFIAGVSDGSCDGSITSIFETKLISNTKKGHRANDDVVANNEAMMSNIGGEDLESAMKDDGYAVSNVHDDRADVSPSPTNRVDMSSKTRKIYPRDNSDEMTGMTTKTKKKTKKKTKESTPSKSDLMILHLHGPRRAVINLLRPRVEKYYTHVKEETANMKKAWVLSSDGPAKYRSTNTDQ